jgi:hypothetical protein
MSGQCHGRVEVLCLPFLPNSEIHYQGGELTKWHPSGSKLCKSIGTRVNTDTLYRSNYYYYFIILIYIQQDATFHSLFYPETALHVSGDIIATCRYSGR